MVSVFVALMLGEEVQGGQGGWVEDEEEDEGDEGEYGECVCDSFWGWWWGKLSVTFWIGAEHWAAHQPVVPCAVTC